MSIIGSCGKDGSKDSEQVNTKSESVEDREDDSDSALTAEEIFSSSLVQDILGEDDEVELQLYLEEQIYPIVSKSSKVTIDRITPSTYFLTFDSNGVMKGFVIRKFYNPVKEEFVFEKDDADTSNFKF